MRWSRNTKSNTRYLRVITQWTVSTTNNQWNCCIQVYWMIKSNDDFTSKHAKDIGFVLTYLLCSVAVLMSPILRLLVTCCHRRRDSNVPCKLIGRTLFGILVNLDVSITFLSPCVTIEVRNESVCAFAQTVILPGCPPHTHHTHPHPMYWLRATIVSRQVQITIADVP